MPIGLVSDHQLTDELASYQKKPRSESGEIIQIPSKGRSPGDNNVPESLRKIIGETSVIDGRQEAVRLAEQFGISSSSVSAYAVGATSTKTYQTPSKEILSHINQSRQRAIKKASKTLNGALSAITQEKLDYTDARDLSVVAKNMSAIIKDLEPPNESSNERNAQQPPQFVIFAPTFRDERSFETINVKE